MYGNFSETSSFSKATDIAFNNLTQTNIIARKSLVLGQTGDDLGSSSFPLPKKIWVGGAMFQTSDPNKTLVDFAFKMGNAVQRNFRLGGRASIAKAGANSFLVGGSDLTAPNFSVGDVYGAITELALGSYASPGTNALSVTGTSSMPG